MKLKEERLKETAIETNLLFEYEMLNASKEKFQIRSYVDLNSLKGGYVKKEDLGVFQKIPKNYLVNTKKGEGANV